jgi:hypothetical protein
MAPAWVPNNPGIPPVGIMALICCALIPGGSFIEAYAAMFPGMFMPMLGW